MLNALLRMLKMKSNENSKDEKKGDGRKNNKRKAEWKKKHRNTQSQTTERRNTEYNIEWKRCNQASSGDYARTYESLFRFFVAVFVIIPKRLIIKSTMRSCSCTQSLKHKYTNTITHTLAHRQKWMTDANALHASERTITHSHIQTTSLHKRTWFWNHQCIMPKNIARKRAIIVIEKHGIQANSEPS